jgi:hypothetical protein
MRMLLWRAGAAMPVQRAAAAIAAAALLLWAAPARAQNADPNTGAITLSGGFDVLNAYHFRGIPQDEDDFGSIMWPYADLGIGLFEGDGGLKSIGVNLGTWNSLHTGGAGLDGPGKLWYESDFYATLGFGFGGGTSIGVTYTAYTSPNGMFSTVKEIAFKFAADDSGFLGGAAVKPYVLIAREFGRDDEELAAGLGQADAGTSLGTYMELGLAPGYSASRVSFAIPIKVGLSLGDYYEGGLSGEDETFGFFSLAGTVTLPFSSEPTRFGTWNVHGGVEYLRLGERNQGFGENQVIGSVGIGFSY